MYATALVSGFSGQYCKGSGNTLCCISSNPAAFEYRGCSSPLKHVHPFRGSVLIQHGKDVMSMPYVVLVFVANMPGEILDFLNTTRFEQIEDVRCVLFPIGDSQNEQATYYVIEG